MEIEGKTILVLGAAGMVGQAITRSLIRENPKTLILASLYEHEVDALVDTLTKENHIPLPLLQKEWGNFLVRHAWKDLSKEELLADSKIRSQWIQDMIEPLNQGTLTSSEIYHLCHRHKPDIIIDAVNLATILSTQDIFSVSKEVLNSVKRVQKEKTWDEAALQTIEKLLLTQYTPHITRHVQVFFQSMVEAQTKFYLKIGTSGSSGMGFNIPFTHSEDNPPQALLAKSALAGAHTLLLFLMARTPGGPIIKEIKPTTAIAWKKINFGPVSRFGKPILLEEAGLADAVSLIGKLKKSSGKKPKYLKYDGEPKALSAPYIDLGENGLFGLGEFEVLTDEGQMEFITPEEIAETVVSEIKGGNTGHDIIADLNHSTIGSTFRGGTMRDQAITKLKELVEKTGVDSIAFERLGPPRLTKVLYEAYLLKKAYGTFEAALTCQAENISETLEKEILENKELCSKIVSVGIPILLKKGDRLLRATKIAIPTDIPGQPDATFDITEENIDRWSHDGWIDLRAKNIELWQSRFQKILEEIKSLRLEESSSAHPQDQTYWNHAQGKTPIEIGKLTSWIITHEAK